MAKNTQYQSLEEILLSVPESEYGQSYQSDMLSMYREFVASAETVSDRRSKANTFYLGICTGCLGSYTYFAIEGLNYVVLSAMAGFAFSLIWMGLIASYKSLNSAKFKVIQEIERHLPLAPYKAEEWVYEKPSGGLVALSKYETYMPWVFIAMYLVIGIYAATVPPAKPAAACAVITPPVLIAERMV